MNTVGATTVRGSGREDREVQFLLLEMVWRQRWWFEKPSDRSPVRKVRLYEFGERALACDDSVSFLSQTQQQKGNEGDDDLNANGVFCGSNKVIDLGVCLTQRKNNSMAHRRLYKSAIS